MYICFELPYPPSTNKMYRTVGNKIILSEEYRKYKKAVADRVLEHRVRRHWTSDRLALIVRCHAPNDRASDIDNRVKTLLDSLISSGVIVDDSYVDQILILRGEVKEPNGSVLVRIDEWSTLPDWLKHGDAMFPDTYTRASDERWPQTSLV